MAGGGEEDRVSSVGQESAVGERENWRDRQRKSSWIKSHRQSWMLQRERESKLSFVPEASPPHTREQVITLKLQEGKQ